MLCTGVSQTPISKLPVRLASARAARTKSVNRNYSYLCPLILIFIMKISFKNNFATCYTNYAHQVQPPTRLCYNRHRDKGIIYT